MVDLYVIEQLEVIKRDQKFWLSFGSIPGYTHDVRKFLRAWKLVFAGALLLSHDYAKIFVDSYVCWSWQDTNIDTVNNNHRHTTVVRWEKC